MIISTTSTLETHKITDYKGIVAGETIIGANIIRDFMASIRDVIGGRSAAYEEVLVEARQTAINEMIQQAQRFGANAIVGVKIDYETINGSMLMVSASGTAVVIVG